LSGLATQRDPNPAFPRLLQHERPEFIQLQHGVGDCHQCLADVRQFRYLFLSQAVTVWRETPKVRDKPRKLLRSS
jgi:hypothetical protein